MADNKQIKGLGLRFARALQMTVKTAVMFTIQHKSVERPIQQSFDLVNTLLKEAGQFTFGFVDNQVILNNLLTTDSSLSHLQTEFLKRGIAAVTFEPGLTMGRYRKVISLLSTPAKAIEEAGGTLSFLENNEVEGARILPAAKNQKKDEEGDTIIDTDSEAYILSKQMAEEQGPRDFLDSIDALLESGCFDQSVRTEVLSEFATRPFDGAGYGVPIPMPNLVALKPGETIVPQEDKIENAAAAESGDGSGAVPARPVTAAGYPSAASAGHTVPGAPPHAGGAYPGVPGGAIDTSEIGTSSGGWRHALGLRSAGSGSFMEMVEASVQRSLLEERGDPQKSYASLARILRNMGVDKILANFPEERRQELTTLPPDQLAAEFIEDTALELAGKKLKSADEKSEKIMIEEEVVRVLARSLKATHMAGRLAQKLAKFISDFSVPPHLQEQIREELQWSTLTSSKKYQRLMEIKHYSALEFRRLIDFSKELLKLRETERVTTLASHYFDFLDEDSQIDATELSRAPELFRAIPLGHGGFAPKTAERLGKVLLRSGVSEFVHVQTATALIVLAQSVATFEDFQDVLLVGALLEKSLARDPEQHARCCAAGLAKLLPMAAIDRIIELFLLQRDSGWGKSAVVLLRYSAPASIESVFNHLIAETDARNRLALVRLIGQLGKQSIEVAYKYLKDERWYVVRNICGVLSELKDPDLADHIVPALEHADPRVQQAALKAVIHSRTVRAAPVLAASLKKLAPNVLDEALNELMFLKHVRSIAGLDDFLISASGNSAASRKAVQVLAIIDDDEALQALSRILCNQRLDVSLRRAAFHALSAKKDALALDLVKEFAQSGDALAEEVSAQLKKAAAGK